MSTTTITGVAMVSVYAVDYADSFRFYSGLLGLENWTAMSDHACYFRLPDDRGMYLVGLRTPVDSDLRSVRTTFAFEVGSASAMFRKLREAGVEIVEDEPMDMGHGSYWFRVYDPSRNVIEIIGGK